MLVECVYYIHVHVYEAAHGNRVLIDMFMNDSVAKLIYIHVPVALDLLEVLLRGRKCTYIGVR